tara:strand:+ start:48 stop:476 length:429 start_codon:yes stop_codon:yes gene_type:complete
MSIPYIKRIQNELQDYEYSIQYDENQIIKISFYFENNLYQFHLNGYPFRPPIKFFKNYNLIDYTPNTIPKKLYELYREKYDLCPCCKSILCPNNWTPGHKFIKIIEEFNKFKNDTLDLQRIRFFKKTKLFPNEIIDQIISFY